MKNQTEIKKGSKAHYNNSVKNAESVIRVTGSSKRTKRWDDWTPVPHNTTN